MAAFVQRLRVQTAEPHGSAPARISAQLRAAELRPAALPPSAHLVIRRLGGLPPWRIDATSVRPPAAWQAAASQALDVLLRRAIRARRGEMPEDADAVLFLDEAEVLAEMALDWLGARLASRWCWQCLYPREEPVNAMIRSWVEAPQSVPAALARLQERHRAEVFVARLPDGVVESLLRGILRVFGLGELEIVVQQVLRLSLAPAVPEARMQVASNPAAPGTAPAAPAPPAPLAQPVPRLLRRLLLEVALHLRTAPRRVRSREFAAEVATSLGISIESPPARERTAKPGFLPQAEKTAVRQAAQPLAIPLQPAEGIFTAAEPHAPEGLASESIPSAEPQPVDRPARSTDSLALFEGIEIETAFGGIFYLLNVAIYLGYYGDFSTPDEPGIDLLPWDFLAQAGRALIGKRLLDDPVWPFLASLAEGEPWEELDDALVRIREWLIEAVGPREKLADFVLEHPARVRLTDTHLDVFLSLDELPIAIRIARLDRDPGWIPAAGRHIRFHFR